MSIPYYRAFEDRYRGSRELIHERQQIYVPFLEPIMRLYPECRALDLGCGRGEWLEILLKTGFKPLGVDLDSGMLDACHALGLPVEKGDALEMLKSIPDESLTVVSGFHIAEHIPFEDLKVLVTEALRVLKPAGLLILETPNAENLVVGTQTFYLDPTHEHPIPHLLLSFLTEYSGFFRSKLLRLQESTVLADGGAVDLMSVLHGVSPDYAIIAQKQGSSEQMEKFDAVFSQDYGLSLETLARRYDAQLSHWMEQNEAVTVELREQLNHVQEGQQKLMARLDESLKNEHHMRSQADANKAQIAVDRYDEQFVHWMGQSDAVTVELREQLNHVQGGLQELKARLNESLENEYHWRSQANANEAQIAALVNSASWRITQPLRTSKSLFRWVIGQSKRVFKRVIYSMLSRSIRFVLSRPGLQLRIRNRIKSYPQLFGFLKQFAMRHVDTQGAPLGASEDRVLIASPRVTRIYCELKLAFERKENR